MMAPDRQLVTVLFIDIQGYTALMQSNERAAVAMLDHYQQTLEDKVNAHNGQVVKNYGDGSLCIFPTALGGVKCAMEIQKVFTRHPVVPVRIGMHVGDVITKHNDIYGDAVNVASRIESMGKVGSVLLSESLHEKVSNQGDLEFVPVGRFAFKNVSKPLMVWAVKDDQLVVPKKHELKGKFRETKSHYVIIATALIAIVAVTAWLILSKKESVQTDVSSSEAYSNSVAVLPFSLIGDDEVNAYLGHGLATDMINILGRVPKLRVIGKTTSFSYADTDKDIPTIAGEMNANYVVEGSVLKNNNNIRYNVQLLDGKTGLSIWSDVINESIDNIFDTQEDIAKQICFNLKMNIAEQSLAPRQTTDVQAYLMYLKAEYFRVQAYRKEMPKIEQLLSSAYALDSTFLPVINALFTSTIFKRRYGLIERDSAQELASLYLRKMHALDSNSYYYRFDNGIYHLEYKYDLSTAIENLRKAITNDNIDVMVMSGSGYYIGLSDLDEGIYIIEKALEQDPLYLWNYVNLAVLYHLNSEFDESTRMFGEYSDITNTNYYDYYIGLNYAFQGKQDSALTHFEKIRDAADRTLGLAVNYSFFPDQDKLNSNLELLESRYSDVHAYNIAAVYALNNQPDKAFAWIDSAHLNRDNNLMLLKTDPMFDSIRSDSRMAEYLVKTYNFPN